MPFPEKKRKKPLSVSEKAVPLHRISERGVLFQGFAERKLGYGVIGNTTDSGPVIPGSSPGIPTKKMSTSFASFFDFQKGYFFI